MQGRTIGSWFIKAIEVENFGARINLEKIDEICCEV